MLSVNLSKCILMKCDIFANLQFGLSVLDAIKLLLKLLHVIGKRITKNSQIAHNLRNIAMNG